jgi:glycosyltransferase involved in cell wall biosynthesis
MALPVWFSIITATLNRKTLLLRALDSVYSQDFPNFEIIVVDGGSTDGTAQTVQKLPRVTFIEGPDQGVYHAFNKGILAAQGDVIGILNSDDVYEPSTFKAVSRAFLHNPHAESVCGSARLFDGIRTIATYEDESCKALTPRAALIGSSILNARFFRRKALFRVGLFDLSYQFVADRDFLARCYEAHIDTIAIPDFVYQYRSHPGSLTFGNHPERGRIIHEELLRLARAWQRSKHASNEIKSIALFLEGRCLAKLLKAELQRGGFSTTLRYLISNERELSLKPTWALAAAGADWLLRHRSSSILRTQPNDYIN